LHTHSPRPVPTEPFVVKKGSKICFIVATPMPCPQSATVIRTRRLPSSDGPLHHPVSQPTPSGTAAHIICRVYYQGLAPSETVTPFGTELGVNSRRQGFSLTER
jgi:hypothetical protein